MNNLVICMIILLTTNLNNGQTDDKHWFGQKWLDENYLFKWKTDDNNKAVVIRVEVQTKGWVGFGFAQHGNASSLTDLVIGWVDYRGKTTFNDFWINELGNRSLDVSQDWILLKGEENATHTVLEFKRHYVTCDETNDLQIFDNDFEISNVVYSYSLIDPNSVNTIGTAVVEEVFHLNLFRKLEPFAPKETDVEIVDNWMNLTIPGSTINIYCQIYKSSVQEKRQVIKIQDIIEPGQTLSNHHFAFTNCPKQANLDKYLGQTFICNDPSLSFIRKTCARFLLASSILSNEPIVFPDNVGIEYDPDLSPYLMFEAHIINPSKNEVKARLSLRLWLIKQFREYSAVAQNMYSSTGFFYDTWGFIIPPKRPRFKVVGSLSTYCFENDEFDQNGIFITHMILHSHQALKSEFRHYRNDRAINVLTQNHFDPKYQSYRPLKTPINFRPNDKMLIICEFSTLVQNKSHTSPWEHCGAILYYYPKMSTLSDEGSYFSRIPYSTMLNITGLNQIDGYGTEIQDYLLIRRPVEYNNTKLIDFIEQNKYRIIDPKDLEEMLISKDMDECCYLANITHIKTKPCVTIKKPTGLYKSLISEIKQNSCSADKTFVKNKVQQKLGSTSHMKESVNKLLLSFRLAFNSLKLSFDTKF